MKYIVILVFAFCFLAPMRVQSQTESSSTTYYLIRHAEKDRSDKTNRDPNLNQEGIERAQNWSIVFENIAFDAIYSTEYNRTIQTAEPTAQLQELEIQAYDPSNLYSKEFAKASFGKTILVVGHSNTTPAFVNAILGDRKYEDMDDDDNGSLFIITMCGGNIIDKVLRIN